MAKKLYYKIGEACKELDIQPYVLRYWETEFQALSPSKSKSGQRVYSAEDLELIRRIKELLYKEGYTIAGAKKKLDSDGLRASAGSEVSTTSAKVDSDSSQAEVEEKASTGVKAQSKPKPKTVPKKKTSAAAASADDPDVVRRLKRGIHDALREAKAILAVLDSDKGSR